MSARVDRTALPAALARLSRKRTVAVVALPDGGSVRTFGTWWDGGSRAEYLLVRIATGEARRVNAPTNPFGSSGVDVKPEPGWVVAEVGVFRGKPATPCFYVREGDAADFFAWKDAPRGCAAAVLLDWLLEHGRDREAKLVASLFPR